MRVPFIVSWAKPRKGNKFQKRLPIEVGGMQSQLGTIMDIYPTVLSVAGCKLPADYVIDGFDLKKQLSGKVNRKRLETFLMHFLTLIAAITSQYIARRLEADLLLFAGDSEATESGTL